MPLKIIEKYTKRIPHSCLVKLQAVYDSLKTAEKKAADLLLSRPEFFANSSIVEASEAAQCSEATFVRLAQRLGYSGYVDLKEHFSEKIAVEDNPTHLYSGISENDDYATIASKVFKATMQALEDTLEILDKKQYKEAVGALCSSNKILLCGIGDAAAVIQSGFQKFIRIGLNVQASPDPDVQMIYISHMKKGDVLIAVSHSGRTKSIVEAAKYAKSKDVKVISITNYPVSPLAKNSDIILLTAAFTEHMEGEIMSKRVTELCVLESLYINVLLKCRNKLCESLDCSNIALEKNKL
ncbi:MurR/RpiR family transcriptional regulator [Defluviitalea saccharophila]|uniref:MurR/RpiR family transcriptional regulator n=1 Tax=Defluviitalea saccharophila TaxID=879970 RepID=A0ABZ2Y177_9FIRM